jgi:hypothetical protein
MPSETRNPESRLITGRSYRILAGLTKPKTNRVDKWKRKAVTSLGTKRIEAEDRKLTEETDKRLRIDENNRSKKIFVEIERVFIRHFAP